MGCGGGCGGSKAKPQPKKVSPPRRTTMNGRPSGGGGFHNIGNVFGTPKVKFGARNR